MPIPTFESTVDGFEATGPCLRAFSGHLNDFENPDLPQRTSRTANEERKAMSDLRSAAEEFIRIDHHSDRSKPNELSKPTLSAGALECNQN